MIKISSVLSVLLLCSATAKGQDRIISFGYSKNFVSKDSSNFALQIDINRVPGKTETGGGYYIVNESFSTDSDWGYYIKPTADVNVGTYTTSAPNNISIGLPIGISYDPPKFSRGLFIFSGELVPDLVADKSFQSYLYYLSAGLVAQYGLVPKGSGENIDITIAGYYSRGKRIQDVKGKIKNDFGKFTIPIILQLSLWRAKADFFRIKFAGTFKYNNLFKDDRLVTQQHNNYWSMKLDFYIIKKLGLNITYNTGYEEPLFRKINALSFGITLAR